jgi:uncharacterized MAPEG superfamily protein
VEEGRDSMEDAKRILATRSASSHRNVYETSVSAAAVVVVFFVGEEEDDDAAAGARASVTRIPGPFLLM